MLGKHTVYIDDTLWNRLDHAYKELALQVHPYPLSRPEFWEELCKNALQHMDRIQHTLVEKARQQP